MTLEDLRIFVAACESGNLSALARKLGRSQSSVSQHIGRLEVELAANLLERTARGIQPTEAGQVLREFAAQGLDAIEMARQRIRDLKDGESRVLSISTGGTTVRHFLGNAVVRFRQHHPSVNLRFLPGNSTQRCFEILRANQADLAFVTTGGAVHGMCERTVALQQLFLLVASDDVRAKRKRLRLVDLKDIRYLGLAEGTSHRELLEHSAGEQGVHLVPEIVFDDFDTASVFVELGLGHAIVPAVQAYHFVRSSAVKAIPIVDLPLVPIGWGFRHWQHLSAPAQQFVRIFDAELQKMRAIPGFQLTPAMPAAD